MTASAPPPDANRRETLRPSLRDGTSGAAYVEFLIAFIPFFTLVLSIIQLSLMYAAHLVVQHSATLAARAAIVVLPDDPAKYGNASVNTVASGSSSSGGGGSSGGARSSIQNLIQMFAPGLLDSTISSPFGGGGSCGGSVSVRDLLGGSGSQTARAVYANRNDRMKAIHEAASIPLLVIAPSITQLLPSCNQSVQKALGNPVASLLSGALFYNRAALAVTFPATPHGTDYTNSWAPSAGNLSPPVTARVTYLFHCAVPIARMIACGAPLGFSRANSAGADELSSAPLYIPPAVMQFSGQRFVILRAEQTLPLQGAMYTYSTSAGSSGTSAGSGG